MKTIIKKEGSQIRVQTELNVNIDVDISRTSVFEMLFKALDFDYTNVESRLIASENKWMIYFINELDQVIDIMAVDSKEEATKIVKISKFLRK